ncbi:MAG TPA: hypothetical protein PLX60_09270 [Chitinophagales bacterium]|jgi:hypothetical protein|nr:hypothetical protein [Chitinophagales bacterium]HPH87448.1 hypothetical protein [Chitinophagales bacterium]
MDRSSQLTNDAIILLAADSSQGFLNKGITLENIIWTIDAVDRNVLTYEEFDDSVKRLLSIEFIKLKAEKIYITEYYRKQKKDYCKKVSGLTNQLQELKKLLSQTIDYNKNTESDNSIDKVINLNSYETAVTSYRAKVDEYISKLK